MSIPPKPPASIPPIDPASILGSGDETLSNERLRGVLSELVQLHSLAMEMGQGSDPMEMIRIAIEGCQRRLGIDRLAVFLVDSGGMVQGTWGTDERGRPVNEENYRSLIKDLPTAKMVAHALEEQYYVAVEEDVPLYLNDRQVGMGWNAMVGLWDGEVALGWVACDNLIQQKPLAPLQIEVLKLFAAALSQALVRGRAEDELRRLNRALEQRVLERTAELNSANKALEIANAELQEMSHSDGLTGISNRRLFDQSLDVEWGRLARDEEDLAVVLIDVDFFKQYNDAVGHLEGDEALRRVAQCLKQNVWRPADLVARYGGKSSFSCFLKPAKTALRQ